MYQGVRGIVQFLLAGSLTYDYMHFGRCIKKLEGEECKLIIGLVVVFLWTMDRIKESMEAEWKLYNYCIVIMWPGTTL